MIANLGIVFVFIYMSVSCEKLSRICDYHHSFSFSTIKDVMFIVVYF